MFGFGVTAIFLLLLAAIAFSGVGWDVLLYAFLFWVVIHGVLAALFTLLAGGHPYTAAGGLLCSMVYVIKSHDPCRSDWCIC